MMSLSPDHINSSVTSMLATAQEMCPTVLQHDSKSLQDLTSVCDSKSRIPNDFVKNLGGYFYSSKLLN